MTARMSSKTAPISHSNQKCPGSAPALCSSTPPFPPSSVLRSPSTLYNRPPAPLSTHIPAHLNSPSSLRHHKIPMGCKAGACWLYSIKLGRTTHKG